MSEEMTARDELYEIAEFLREADQDEKDGKARKEKLRGAFFELISEIVREEIPLATQSVEIEMGKDFDPEAWCRREYPEWRVVAVQPTPDGTAVITIEENEDFKKFEFVYDGFKFGRTIRMDGKGFDAQRFYEDITESKFLEWYLAEDPDELLEILDGVVYKQVVYEYVFDEAKAQQVMADHPETVAIFQRYLNPGTPKPTLLPIKPVKDQE